MTHPEEAELPRTNVLIVLSLVAWLVAVCAVTLFSPLLLLEAWIERKRKR